MRQARPISERPKILNEKPPVFEAVCAAFDIYPINAVFTYGDTIYNPGGIPLSDDLVEHEKVHIKQQSGTTDGAALWWGKYLRNPEFRIEQEARAYGRQYAFICESCKDKNLRNRILLGLSLTLSGKLYDKGVSYLEARGKIKKYSGVK